jgi:PERQ amino acid-rich with GYF domain-containing protein
MPHSIRDSSPGKMPPLRVNLLDLAITDGNESQRARRDIRPTNGIATFRRPSSTPFVPSISQAEPPLPPPTTETSTSQLPNVPLEPADNYRYSKNFLLDIYQQQKDSGALKDDISHLYAETWNPEQSSTTNGRGGWGRSTESRDNHGPDVCWNKSADTEPLALQEMTEEEKHVSL